MHARQYAFGVALVKVRVIALSDAELRERVMQRWRNAVSLQATLHALQLATIQGNDWPSCRRSLHEASWAALEQPEQE